MWERIAMLLAIRASNLTRPRRTKCFIATGRCSKTSICISVGLRLLSNERPSTSPSNHRSTRTRAPGELSPWCERPCVEIAQRRIRFQLRSSRQRPCCHPPGQEPKMKRRESFESVCLSRLVSARLVRPCRRTIQSWPRSRTIATWSKRFIHTLGADQ